MALGIIQALDSAAAVDPDRLFGDIHDAADDARSLAVSIREAAFRRDRALPSSSSHLPRRPLNDRAAKLKSAHALSCSIREWPCCA